MVPSRWIPGLAFVLLIAGCGSTTLLPDDEIPPAFVFGYEYTRGEAPAVTSAVNGAEDLAPEPIEEAALPDEETAGTPAAEPEEMPAAEPEEMPVDEPEEMPVDEPEEMPVDEPEEMPVDEPEEMPVDEPEEMPADEPEGGETRPVRIPEDPDAEPSDPDAEPEEMPADEPEEPEREPRVLPARLELEVRATGEVYYDVTYDDPGENRHRGLLQIDDETLQRVYDLVRAADLEDMEERYVGEDAALGRETYHVSGADLRHVWIDVYGTRVDRLTKLFNDVMDLLPEEQILVPPAPELKVFLMDRATGEIHRANCPRVEEIAEGARIEIPRVQAGLNAGGYPCTECKPLSR